MICDYYQKETDWGCKHVGDALIFKSENYYNYLEEESAIIEDAKDATFVFLVQHYFTDNEKYYEKDHKMPGTLSVFINNENRGSFEHPKNWKQDSHLPNGDPNPDYNGSFIVTVKCNELCECTVMQNDPERK